MMMPMMMKVIKVKISIITIIATIIHNNDGADGGDDDDDTSNNNYNNNNKNNAKEKHLKEIAHQRSQANEQMPTAKQPPSLHKACVCK